MNQQPKPTTIANKSDKKTKLILSLIFDGIGMLSYIVPVFAEIEKFVAAASVEELNTPFRYSETVLPAVLLDSAMRTRGVSLPELKAVEALFKVEDPCPKRQVLSFTQPKCIPTGEDC